MHGVVGQEGAERGWGTAGGRASPCEKRAAWTGSGEAWRGMLVQRGRNVVLGAALQETRVTALRTAPRHRLSAPHLAVLSAPAGPRAAAAARLAGHRGALGQALARRRRLGLDTQVAQAAVGKRRGGKESGERQQLSAAE
jgi:hypothetical protein